MLGPSQVTCWDRFDRSHCPDHHPRARPSGLDHNRILDGPLLPWRTRPLTDASSPLFHISRNRTRPLIPTPGRLSSLLSAQSLPPSLPWSSATAAAALCGRWYTPSHFAATRNNLKWSGAVYPTSFDVIDGLRPAFFVNWCSTCNSAYSKTNLLLKSTALAWLQSCLFHSTPFFDLSFLSTAVFQLRYSNKAPIYYSFRPLHYLQKPSHSFEQPSNAQIFSNMVPILFFFFPTDQLIPNCMNGCKTIIFV